MANDTHIGLRIKEARKARGLNQEEFADSVGIARSYVSSIERGHDLPGRDTLQAIADFLGQSVDSLSRAAAASKVNRSGEFVDDPDKLALLRMWDALETDDDRRRFLQVVAAWINTPNP